jgi:hypothetical protein
MSSIVVPIAFAGSALRRYRHVCAFFSSLQEEYDTLLPFVRDGLQRGERAYHENPFFVAPEALLREVVGRSRPPTAYRA